MDKEVDIPERSGYIFENEVKMPSVEHNKPIQTDEKIPCSLSFSDDDENAKSNKVNLVPQEVKIAQSFDDMFKSFLQNPSRSPVNGSNSSFLDIKPETLSTNSDGKRKQVGQVESSDGRVRTGAEEKSKKRRGRPRKTVEKDNNIDEMKAFSPNICKTNNISAYKKQSKEIILVTNDEDNKPKTQLRNVLSKNAKLPNIPIKVDFARGKDTGLCSPNSFKPNQAGSNQVLKSGSNPRLVDTAVNARKNQPLTSKMTISKPLHEPLNQVKVLTKPQIISVARGKQSPNLTKSIVRLSATNNIVSEPAQRSSRLIGRNYDTEVQVVQHLTKTLQHPGNRSVQAHTGKRKISTESNQTSKIAKLESKQHNDQNASKLFEFIASNILSKPEMKPHGQIANLHQCKLCSFKSNSKWHIENHIESIHADIDVDYPCNLCDFMAKTRANYYAHGKKKHGFNMDANQY